MFRLARIVHLLVVLTALVVFKVLFSIITTFYKYFPFPSLLDAAYRHSKNLRVLFSFKLRDSTKPAHFSYDAAQLAASAGYRVEHHCVVTDDGFVLGLHRLARPLPVESTGSTENTQLNLQPELPSEEFVDPDGNEFPSPSRQSVAAASVDAQFASAPRPVVLLQHGLMQNSECFLVDTPEHSLAIHLFEAGFDVWLGNNRGNKYSMKHLVLKPHTNQFWDFSIDDMARYDVPATIEYIVNYTGAAKISYIGFSQGTAQCFAALSTQPRTAAHVNAFVALSPAATVRGLAPSLLRTLIETNHEFLFLLLGKKAMLPSANSWSEILSVKSFANVIDVSVRFLFGWNMSQISATRKPYLYYHLYSYSSVKAVVHWFQILRDGGRLQMYDDAKPSVHRVQPQYDVTTIRVPMAVYTGGKDTVIDASRLMKLLPQVVEVHHEEEYEHLDFLWADTAKDRVFPAVAQFLKKHSSAEVEERSLCTSLRIAPRMMAYSM